MLWRDVQIPLGAMYSPVSSLSWWTTCLRLIKRWADSVRRSWSGCRGHRWGSRRRASSSMYGRVPNSGCSGLSSTCYGMRVGHYLFLWWTLISQDNYSLPCSLITHPSITYQHIPWLGPCSDYDSINTVSSCMTSLKLDLRSSALQSRLVVLYSTLRL